MKMSLENAPYFDQATGMPVEGRLRICEHGTDVLATVYTLEGSNYIEAQNPCLVHGGYPDASMFAELGILDIHLEKYIGTPGNMSVESPDSDFEQIDVFEYGLDYDISQATANIVNTVGDLRNANPELGLVTVTWYAEPGDCMPRQYIWDAAAQNEEDGGYVVRSDVSDTGRWILVWGDEVLPCTVYGVTPGDEGNMSLLLNYPNVVGSFQLKTAPIVRFPKGTYTSTVMYATNKQVAFDSGAQFPSGSFNCPSIVLFGDPNSYIADFTFNTPNVTAHSSWFRTVDGFLSCGADELVVDSTNYFTNTQLQYARTLSNKTLVYPSNKRLPITYVNNGRLVLSRCNIEGVNIFNASDKITFQYTDFKDEWFGNYNIDFLGNVLCRSTSLNTIRLENFKNTMNYIHAMKYDGRTTVDLAGRSVTTWTNDFATEVRNAFVDNFGISMGSTADVTLVNVHSGSFSASCRYITIKGGCDIHFSSQPSASAVWAEDSRVGSAYKWSSPSTQFIAENCWIGIVFDYAQNNEDAGSWMQFDRCTFQENVSISTKRLTMHNCSTYNNSIKIYPYKSEDKYRMYVDLQDNTFNNSSPIEFTKLKVDRYGQTQEDDDVYDIIVSWTIVGNTFIGNDEGLRCRYWQNRVGSYYGRTFIAWSDDNSITYFGNVGKCPSDTAKGVSMNNGTNCEQYYYWVELGDDRYDTLDRHKQGPVMLNLKSDTRAYHWQSEAINGNGFPIRYRYDGSENSDLNSTTLCWIYPWAHLNEPIENGSLFDVGFSKWGKIRENDRPYYPWYWVFR